MKFSYPIRNLNGSEFQSHDEVMSLIASEPHGSWAIGANGFWHGGIHISDVSQPFSALIPDAQNSEDPVPLQFMTDGTIVAYRLNDTYPTARHCGTTLCHSSSFVLVKSLCKPNPDREESWLEFYCLYMHLAALNDYPSSQCYKVAADRRDITLRRFKKGHFGVPEGDEAKRQYALYPAPPRSGQVINDGDRIVVSRQGRFYLHKNGKSELKTFGLARLLKAGKPGKEQFWVTLDPELLEPDEEMYDLLPDWMAISADKGIFNDVVMTDEGDEWKVNAGAPLGFMGLTERPDSTELVKKEWFIHLECLSVDSRMPRFLSNPGRVQTDKRMLRAAKGELIYLRDDFRETPEFRETGVPLGAQQFLSRDSAIPFLDDAERWWYNVSGSGWLPQDKVLITEQFDLLSQGFTPLEEVTANDVSETFKENWVITALELIASSAEHQRVMKHAFVPDNYRRLIAKLENPQYDGVNAVRDALRVRHSLVRDVVDRLVIRHHSEWYGSISSGRWNGVYKDLDVFDKKYCEKWQSDMEWMSQVEPFNQDEPIWHFHPIVFLDALKESKKKGWAHSPFANLLGRVESNNDYTAYNRTYPHPKPTNSEAKYGTSLTSLTIQQVMDAQKKHDMFATGRFQIIPSTLKDAISKLALDMNALYDESLQDKIFEEYLIKIKRKPIIDFLEGDGSVEDAMYAWAMEFASAGVRKGKKISRNRIAESEGVSYYTGDGLNKAHILPDKMKELLEESKNGI